MADHSLKPSKRTNAGSGALSTAPIAQLGGMGAAPALEAPPVKKAAPKRTVEKVAAPKTTLKKTAAPKATLAAEKAPVRAASKKKAPVQLLLQQESAVTSITMEPLEDEIAREAYLIAERNGFPADRDFDNWLEAESIVLARHAAAPKN